MNHNTQPNRADDRKQGRRPFLRVRICSTAGSIVCLAMSVAAGRANQHASNPSTATATTTAPTLIAQIIEQDPWAMVIGADTPRVALYADGTLIFRNMQAGSAWPYLAARLDALALRELQAKLGPNNEFLAMKDSYELSHATDQPTTQIVLVSDGKAKTVSAYGFRERQPDQREVWTTGQGNPVPSEFKRVYSLLTGLNPADAAPWTPEFLEVMIWPYDYAPEGSIDWPAEWPDINHRLSFRWGDSYSLILAGKHLKELQSFVRRRKERQAVRINGKKWAIVFRPVMPGGDVWNHIQSGNR